MMLSKITCDNSFMNFIIIIRFMTNYTAYSWSIYVYGIVMNYSIVFTSALRLFITFSNSNVDPINTAFSIFV